MDCGDVCEVMWRREDGGVEHVRATLAGDGDVAVDGVVAQRGDDGVERRTHYLLRCDNAWRVREVRVELPEDGGALLLRSDGAGRWTRGEDGAAMPQLDGCVDVDLYAVVFTNTLPVRRLRLALGASVEIAVAFVLLPSLEVRRVRQRYTRVSDMSYRYEGLESGFTTVLRVDGEGLVIDYPGLGRRMWATAPH
ncbi:MAG TPA: putative glycolipid-binding domain-containing protein [Candidatus Dormibacteraeota bacterium]|jgi:hypothetical protein|nr:putative glycolipid-binding domain-containing protein [Candidatus Dormibacteraeota bacterium]